MRTDIVFKDIRRTFDSPPMCLEGITVVVGGDRICSIMEADCLGRTDEEIFLDHEVKVIFHRYDIPELAEVMKEFEPFSGMKFVEIEMDGLYLSQTV